MNNIPDHHKDLTNRWFLMGKTVGKITGMQGDFYTGTVDNSNDYSTCLFSRMDIRDGEVRILTEDESIIYNID